MPPSIEDLKLMAELPLTAHGRVFFDWLKEECAKEQDDIDENPRFDDENIKRDVRYKLGSVTRMKMIINMPKRAAEELTNRRT